MVQDQGSCHCNPLEAASELQFRGALSGMVLFMIYRNGHLLYDRTRWIVEFQNILYRICKCFLHPVQLSKPFFENYTSDPNKVVSQAVEDLCVHKMAGNLYRRLQQECETHIASKLRALVGRSPDAVVFLSHVASCWQDHCDQMLVIRSIALYLDRTYVIQNSGVRSLWDMGLQLFRCHLSACPEVELKTVSGLLRLIEKER